MGREGEGRQRMRKKQRESQWSERYCASVSERIGFLGTARIRIQSVPQREYRTNMYTEKRREAREIEAEIK